VHKAVLAFDGLEERVDTELGPLALVLDLVEFVIMKMTMPARSTIGQASAPSA